MNFWYPTIEKPRHLATHENAGMDRKAAGASLYWAPIRSRTRLSHACYQHSARDSSEGRNIE